MRAAHVTLLALEAATDLQGLSDSALHHVWENVIDLPAADLSLLVTLPRSSAPTRLIAASLLEAVAISIGVESTPAASS